MFPGNILVMAVADGAGSAPNAEPGCSYCCLERNASGRGTNHKETFAGNRGDARARVSRGSGGPECFARWQSLAVESYATTLSLVIAMDDCTGVAQTGDGIVVVRTADGRLCRHPLRNRACMPTRRSSYGPGGAEPGFLEMWEYGVAIAVLTDGLLPLAVDYADHTPHAPFFDPMLAEVAATTDM